MNIKYNYTNKHNQNGSVSSQIADILDDILTARLRGMRNLKEKSDGGADPKVWISKLDHQIKINEETEMCMREFIHAPV